jgi:hypothetical protein
LKDLLRPQVVTEKKVVEEIDDFIVESIVPEVTKIRKPRKKKIEDENNVEAVESILPVDSEATQIRKPRKKKTEEISASADVKTVIRKKVKDG